MKEIIKNILINLGQVKLFVLLYFDFFEIYIVKKVLDVDIFNVVVNGFEVEMIVCFVYIDILEIFKGWGDLQVEKMNYKNKNLIYCS